MYLIEYGLSSASEISKKMGIPKSSVNFIADNLWEKGIVKKSFRAKTGYYEADIDLLEKSILTELSEKQEALKEILPTLREKNKNTISRPKITFIDGIEGCKLAYAQLLKVKGEFLEFGAHADLENAFGSSFMDDFIAKRVEQKIFCDSVGTT
jgi:sugar-specific transcriptional regulator TrmB